MSPPVCLSFVCLIGGIKWDWAHQTLRESHAKCLGDESRVFCQDAVSGGGALASEDVASPTSTLDSSVTHTFTNSHRFLQKTLVGLQFERETSAVYNNPTIHFTKQVSYCTSRWIQQKGLKWLTYWKNGDVLWPILMKRTNWGVTKTHSRAKVKNWS